MKCQERSKLSERSISRVDAWYMVRRRARDAGVETAIGSHSFRAIGITDYLERGGDINIAKRMAGHSNVGGSVSTLDLGEGSSEFINSGDASGIDLFGSLAKALSFFPALGLFRLGEGGLPSAFDRLEQLGANVRFRDATSLFADPLDLPMLAVAEPPDAAANEEALAGVDLVAEDLVEVAGLGAEDFLNYGRVAQPCKDSRDAAACLSELRRNAGDKDGRLVHELLVVASDLIPPRSRG